MSEIKKENGDVKILLKSKFIFTELFLHFMMFSILISQAIKIRNVF